MPSTEATNGRTTLLIEYVSVIHFSTVDNFDLLTISLDETQIPFAGLKHLNFRPYQNGGLQLFQIECYFEVEIRKDKKEYIALKKVLDGNEPDQEYNACLNSRLETYEGLVSKLMEYLIWRKKMFINTPFKKDIETKSCIWTLDGETKTYPINKEYHIAGEVVEIEVNQKDLLVSDFDDFKNFLDKETNTPLYHELFDESYRLVVTEQYRGAFLTLYTALEVGTKKLVQHELPETEWIKDSNAQAPPMERIYPELLNKESRILMNSTEFALLKNMTFTRNNIAHQGKDVDAKSFRKYRNFVRKMLYRIDAQMGYSWAENEEESTWYTDNYKDFLQIIVP